MQTGTRTTPALAPAPGAGGPPLASFAGRPLARIGSLEVRLAASEAEVRAAQAVRFRVFVEELGAAVPSAARVERRDADRFDALCDHLLVLDTSLPGSDADRIVGTYRLLQQDMAALAGGFYSESEFELPALVARHPRKRFLELGRSCVLPGHRGRRAVEAMWAGIWAYVRQNGIDVMAGCASFPGTVPAAHAQALSFLAQQCRAEAPWRVCAVPARWTAMDLMPPEAVNARAAFAQLPPLLKGYLRLGGRIGDGCVVDGEFQTVDVFVVLPVEAIGRRYIDHYGGA